jgi:hypothetical protein
VIRRVALLLVVGAILTGCTGASVPTSEHPVCSWDSAVPANSEPVCSAVFHTINAVARAEQMGNDAAIKRLVAGASARRRIISYGRTLRAQGVRDLHVVPSITLDRLHPHTFGAGFYLKGAVRGGRINAPLTLELRMRGSGAVVIADQPGQEW